MNLMPDECGAAIAGLKALNDKCSEQLHAGSLGSDCVDCGACSFCDERQDLLLDLFETFATKRYEDLFDGIACLLAAKGGEIVVPDSVVSGIDLKSRIQVDRRFDPPATIYRLVAPR
jgi:hypothetical protein